jgi:hypothetical protein
MAPPTAGPIGTAAPTPSPTPSPTPNTGPAISDIEVSDVGIREIGACSPFSVTFSLLASDPTGVKTVRFYWRKPGAGSYTFKSMSLVAGRWTASLDGNGDNISPSGTLNYYFVAYDSLDATTSTGVSSITVYPASDCIL